MRIDTPVKHLRWRVLQKQSVGKNRLLFSENDPS